MLVSRPSHPGLNPPIQVPVRISTIHGSQGCFLLLLRTIRTVPASAARSIRRAATRPALNGSCFRKNSKLSARPKNNICSSTMTSALRWSASAGPSSTGAWPGEPRHGRSHTGAKGGPAALCRGAAVLKPAICRWVSSRLLSTSTELARLVGHRRSWESHLKGVGSKLAAASPTSQGVIDFIILQAG